LKNVYYAVAQEKKTSVGLWQRTQISFSNSYALLPEYDQVYQKVGGIQWFLSRKVSGIWAVCLSARTM
jgi:hypothetical protein